MKRLTAWILALFLLLGSFGLPAALAEEPSAEPAEASSVDQAERGAKTWKQLLAILDGKDLFTAEQVDCMSMEMLMACLTVCDAENGLERLEHYDPEAIAELLNERLFDAVKGVGLRYRITDLYDGGFTEEIGQQTLSWFESQKDSFVSQYGEENYRRVHEETAGYEEFLFPEYTVCYADGSTKKDGYTRGNPNGLTIIKSNGRYFWMAMDLFANMEEPEEPSSPLQGKVEDGWYIPADLGIRVRLEGWSVTDRKTINRIMYGDDALASAAPEELLDQGLPYGDLMIQKGYSTVFFLLLKLPVKAGDGSDIQDLKEYLDEAEASLRETFAGDGARLISVERSQTELGGRTFEMIRLHADFGSDQYFTMLGTEEDGRLLVVNINCLGSDDTDELLSRFAPETYPILGQVRLEDCTLTIHYDDGLILRNRPLSLEELMEVNSAHHTAIPGTELVENEDFLALLAKLDPEELPPVQDLANYAGRIYPTVYYVLTDPRGEMLFDLGMGWDNLDKASDERPASVNFNGEKIPFDELYYTCVARWLTQAHYVPGYCDVMEVQDG